MTERERGLHSGGAFQWFFQRITGAVLLLILIGHFWVLHFFPQGQHGVITYDIVMNRLNNPFWRTFDLMFLVFGIYHGMNGVTLLIHDYVHAKGWRMALVGTLWVAAVFFLLIGSMTILGLAGGKA